MKTITAVALALCLLLNPTAFAASEEADVEKYAKACRENLARIDGATEQFALEFRHKIGTTVTWQDLLDPNGTGKVGAGYLRSKPVCPAKGIYTIGKVGSSPTCSIGAAKDPKHSHVLEPFEAPKPDAAK